MLLQRTHTSFLMHGLPLHQNAPKSECTRCLLFHSLQMRLGSASRIKTRLDTLGSLYYTCDCRVKKMLPTSCVKAVDKTFDPQHQAMYTEKLCSKLNQELCMEHLLYMALLFHSVCFCMLYSAALSWKANFWQHCAKIKKAVFNSMK